MARLRPAFNSLFFVKQIKLPENMTPEDHKMITELADMLTKNFETIRCIEQHEQLVIIKVQLPKNPIVKGYSQAATNTAFDACDTFAELIVLILDLFKRAKAVNVDLVKIIEHEWSAEKTDKG